MKEFGPRGGASLVPALDPPMRIHPSPPAPIDCSYRYVVFMFLDPHPHPLPASTSEVSGSSIAVIAKNFHFFENYFYTMSTIPLKVRLHLASECEGDGMINVAFKDVFLFRFHFCAV